MFGSQKAPSRRGRAQSIDSDDESSTIQLQREMNEAQEEDEEFESSEEDSHPTSDSNTILSEDPFGNEDSQKLFESIGALLPLIFFCQHSNLVLRQASEMRCRSRPRSPPARHCRQAICWEVLFAAELDRHPLPSGQQTLHSICYAYRLSTYSSRKQGQDLCLDRIWRY